MFAASCIGVIALVVLLEFLRRLGREYDRKLPQSSSRHPLRRTSNDSVTSEGHATAKSYVNMNKADTAHTHTRIVPLCSAPAHVSRVTLLRRQLIRSLLHVATFAIAYMVMLLAMYYNGKLFSNLTSMMVMMLMRFRIHYHKYLDRRLLGIVHIQLGSARHWKGPGL